MRFSFQNFLYCGSAGLFSSISATLFFHVNILSKVQTSENISKLYTLAVFYSINDFENISAANLVGEKFLFN
jgi:hypothetical protein